MAMSLLKNPVDRIWLALMVATAITFWLGESGLASSAGAVSVGLMFGLSLLKGVLVILDFMELRQAPALWRRVMLGWLTVVIALILLAWTIARWRAGA